MRQLLVEAARRRNSGKRGGGAKIPVNFDDAFQKKPSGEDELLALNTALEMLAQMNPRQAMMVESRFFGGLDVAETAALLKYPKLPFCATGEPQRPGSLTSFAAHKG